MTEASLLLALSAAALTTATLRGGCTACSPCRHHEQRMQRPEPLILPVRRVRRHGEPLRRVGRLDQRGMTDTRFQGVALTRF